MPCLADLIYEETKTLAEPQAREVLDFIGYLKTKANAPMASAPPGDAVESDEDWSEFEQLAGAWSGRFNRSDCYDRPILR